MSVDESKIESMSGEAVGHMLRGFGINLLVSNTERTATFLTTVLGFRVIRLSADYGILKHRDVLYQIHSDGTYGSHPMLSIVPENDPRGIGVELRLYEVDPDEAERRANDGGYHVFQTSTDKPHGLRECYLFDPDGYCWVPSVKS